MATRAAEYSGGCPGARNAVVTAQVVSTMVKLYDIAIGSRFKIILASATEPAVSSR